MRHCGSSTTRLDVITTGRANLLAAALSTAALTSGALLGSPLAPALAVDAPPTAYAPLAVDERSNDIVTFVLQSAKAMPAFPEGTTAELTMRVVGRNTKGPLATAKVPLGGRELPAPLVLGRKDLREGVADFLWATDDIYVRADVISPTGKTSLTGRSKAKAVEVDGSPAHAAAFVTLE